MSNEINRDELLRWMYGTRQVESGHDYSEYNSGSGAAGAYQFVTKTWRPQGWSRDPELAAKPYVGSDGKEYYNAMEAPPHIQDERAFNLAASYYRKFGNWYLVSVAWHAGEDDAAKFARGEVDYNLNDGGMTTHNYAQLVQRYAFGDNIPENALANLDPSRNRAPVTGSYEQQIAALNRLQGRPVLPGGRVLPPQFATPLPPDPGAGRDRYANDPTRQLPSGSGRRMGYNEELAYLNSLTPAARMSGGYDQQMAFINSLPDRTDPYELALVQGQNFLRADNALRAQNMPAGYEQQMAYINSLPDQTDPYQLALVQGQNFLRADNALRAQNLTPKPEVSDKSGQLPPQLTNEQEEGRQEAQTFLGLTPEQQEAIGQMYGSQTAAPSGPMTYDEQLAFINSLPDQTDYEALAELRAGLETGGETVDEEEIEDEDENPGGRTVTSLVPGSGDDPVFDTGGSGVEDLLATQFGGFAFFLQKNRSDMQIGFTEDGQVVPANDPNAVRVKNVLDVIVEQGITSPERVLGLVKNTEWWQNTDARMRQYDVATADMSPAEKVEYLEPVVELLRNEAQFLGFQLDSARATALAENIMRMGEDQDPEYIRNLLVAEGAFNASEVTSSNFAGARDEIVAMSKRYFTPITQDDAAKFAQDVYVGSMTPEALEQYFREMAGAKFPQLQNSLNAGITPEAYFAPYKYEIEQMLDRPNIDLYEEFGDVVQYIPDTGTGEARPMTLGEVRKYVRGLDEWQQSSQGKDSARALSFAIGKTFGEVA